MALTLYFLRHAKSNWDDRTLPDRDRPLAPRGRRACTLIAGYMRREHITPDLVLCSPSARTRDTLARIATGFQDQVEAIIEEGLYEASAADLLARLREVGDGVASLMLIGHHPAIQELALDLDNGGAPREAVSAAFPTAALATLRFTGTWAGLAPGAAKLTAFVKPRELEGVRE